jgi:hypothetical protein
MNFVTVNSTKYGGSGGNYAVFAGGNSSASEIALHEVAHSFSRLADEYGGNPGSYSGNEPNQVNVTKDPTGDKWSRWLGYSQPGIGTIGAYEGGLYYDAGIYRPSQNSKMRNLNRPFDAVSREKIILDIYRYVNPFDAWAVNSAPLVDPDELWVDVVDSSVIGVEWFVNDILIPTATEATFNLSALDFGPGDYTVTARGYDPTAFDAVNGWVRMSQNQLEQFVSWQVTLTAPIQSGDFDFDGDVDGRDFLVWQRDPGVGDLADWQTNYATGEATFAAVPEPATVFCCLLFTPLMLGRRPSVHRAAKLKTCE